MSTGLEKIAVILRGHKRTWKFTKDTILKYFKDKADRVDYYISWWNVGDVSKEQIIQDFAGYSLKKIVLADYKPEYGDPFYGPAYLSDLVVNDIFEEEVLSNKKYDLIIDTRPDVIHYSRLMEPLKWSCPPWSIGFVRIEHKDKSIHGLDDHCFIGNSASLALWNKRIFMDMTLSDRLNLEKGHHSLYNTFTENYNLHKFEIPWFHSFIVRPSICEIYPSVRVEDFYTAETIWQQSKIIDRKAILEKAGISNQEYEMSLGIGHIKYIQE